MPTPSQSDVTKPEVRGLSAYTLKHFDADVKLDQNENPYELPADLKREVVERVLRRPWGRYPEFVPAAIIRTLGKFTGWHEDGILVGNGSNELIQASLSEAWINSFEPLPTRIPSSCQPVNFPSVRMMAAGTNSG